MYIYVRKHFSSVKNLCQCKGTVVHVVHVFATLSYKVPAGPWIVPIIFSFPFMDQNSSSVSGLCYLANPKVAGWQNSSVDLTVDW